MEYSVIVIVQIYFTLSQVLHASKSECTDYYIILEEEELKVSNSVIYTYYTPVITNKINWIELRNHSKDVYDEIRGYGDCVLEIIDCKETETDCENLQKTNHLGSHEFITSTINDTDYPSSTYITEYIIEKKSNNKTNYLTMTTTENNFVPEFDRIDETTKNKLNIDMFVMNSNCTKNATNALVNCNDNESETTFILECEYIERDICEVQVTENVMSETSTKLSDFNVSLQFNDINNKTKIDITSICNKSISMNNKSNGYTFICEKIYDNTLKIANDTAKIRPFIDNAVISNTSQRVYIKPDEFSIILVYHNKTCTYNGNELNITSNCRKVTNLNDVNGTFSLECQMIKDCVYTHENKSAFDIDRANKSAISRLEREKEKRNNLILYIVIGVVAAAGGIFVLAMIAKFTTKLQSRSFHVPEDPYFTHPEFRDDAEEESPC